MLLLLAALLPPAPLQAATLPPGFQDTVVFDNLTAPTAFRFASDGRVFVAEKSGLIKVFDDLSDTTPTIFADLRTNVHNFWDRGLLGLELDPNFPTNPYVYVLYTYDAAIGAIAPRWGIAGATSDGCANPPSATIDGCVVGGRLSRLRADGNVMTGAEQVLVEDWCQQFPSHSLGSMVFGADGALYASGGEGASFDYVDYGQSGGTSGSPTPKNPCGDPPAGGGGTQTSPTAEGGALRSQDLRTSGDPVGLSGTIIRVDPVTGAGLPDNPLASSSDPNARRIVAYGLRNPMRITKRPGTSEIWIGDVGGLEYEEINRIANPASSAPLNFGWPCYEGAARMPGFDAANLNICENLYAQSGAVTQPFFAYNHSAAVVPGDGCPTGSSSVTGVAFQFYSGGAYPSSYNGALFFGDYSRSCIWVMFKGTNGLPNPATITPFVAPAEHPVDIQISPAGELFYADYWYGRIRRVRYFGANQPPIVSTSATPTSGAAPLSVSFDGSGSSDSDPGDTISYAWDLDGDGQFDDSTAMAPSYTYNQPGTYTVRLRVTDSHAAASTSDPIAISVGNTPPVPVIDMPASGAWKVGDLISFAGHASDAQQGTLPASALSWELIQYHCPSNCHTHPVQTFAGVAGGSFSAPDHEYPSYLVLQLTATDAGGLSSSASIQLDPHTTSISFRSQPSGLQLVVGSTSQATPFSRTVIVGSNNSTSATTPQTLAGTSYTFTSWSDGGSQTHNIIANGSGVYTATFTAAPPPAANLLANAGFEQDTNNDGKPDIWSTNSRATRSNTVVRTGTYAIKHSATDNNGYTISQTVKNLTAGPYNISGYVNIPATSDAFTYIIEVRWRNASGSTLKTDIVKSYTAATAGWDSASANLTAPVGTVSAQFRMKISSLNATIYTDDLALQAGTPTSDTTPPSVTSRSPAAGALSVDPATNATAVFSEGVVGVSASTMQLKPQGGTTAVAANVSYNAAIRTATLDPSTSLAANTTYTLQLNAGITDAASNPLAPLSWNFTTAAAPPAGLTYNFPAVADTYVSQSSSASSYGGASSVSAVGGSSAKYAYLRFSVSGLPSGAQVASVKLRLVVTNDSTSGGIFNSITNTSWAEGITWSNKPLIDGLQRASLGAVSMNQIVEVDLTAAISGNGTYSFAITLPASNTNTLGYAARENSTTAMRPQLVVTTR